MKTLRTIALLCAIICSLSSVGARARKKALIETVVYRIEEMHCATCEKKIKNCITFERGLKSVETNLQERTLTLTYDANKTTEAKLAQRLVKSRYNPQVLKSSAAVEQGKGQER